MDTSSVIAIAGLTTALLGTLTVPLLQSYFTSRREAAARMDERRHATYVDAITYAQIIEARVNDLTTDPLARTSRELPTSPDEVLIRAKLELVGDSRVIHAFDQLVSAWDTLAWQTNEEGPTGPYGEFVASTKDKQVVRVTETLKDLRIAMRSKALDSA